MSETLSPSTDNVSSTKAPLRTADSLAGNSWTSGDNGGAPTAIDPSRTLPPNGTLWSTWLDSEINGTTTAATSITGDGFINGTDWVSDPTVRNNLTSLPLGWLTDMCCSGLPENGTVEPEGPWNCTEIWNAGCPDNITGEIEGEPTARAYWALLLLLFPVFTVFGNVLVILSVYKERSLQSVTNYFIVSLAVADLLVAALVMPFAVYTLVNENVWNLSPTVCDFYIAMDVICSTSSIFNLVAISIDRFIAVTQPIKYAKHKNNNRVVLTIAIVWVVSAAIGSPIVLGLNTAPNKDPQMCIFYNTDFIIYSSLSSFYIPCIIMVFLYYRIFKAIHERARKAAAGKKPHPTEFQRDIVIENVAQTRHRLQETALSERKTPPKETIPEEPEPGPPPDPENPTESGSQNDEEEPERSPNSEDCHIIPNDKSTEFMLSPVQDEEQRRRPSESNCNHDSGCAASAQEETPFMEGAPDSPERALLRSEGSTSTRSPKVIAKRNGAATPLQTSSEPSPPLQPPPKKKSRFTLARAHKSSRKKREKSSAKRERKATKTLAIVLGVFLFCWVPFFTCNIMNALCLKWNIEECQPSLFTFFFTTWLGYMNSFINPVIYTIFNTEFRKAFKKILTGHS